MEYVLRRYRRSKNIRISVKPGGLIRVSAPLRTPKYFIEQFVLKQAVWIQGAVEKMVRIEPLKKQGSEQGYYKYKKEAHTVFSQRLRELNRRYQFFYKRISIRNQSTRWGSCSKSGTLSFNYRLLFQPSEIRDYVLVHELCHLQEMNHSKKFWELVKATVPDYPVLMAKLKSHI